MVLLNHEACKAKTTQTCTIHNHCFAYHSGLLGVCAYHTGLLGVIKGVHIIGSHQGWPRIVHIYAGGGGGGGGGLRFYIASVVEANQVNKLQ